MKYIDRDQNGKIIGAYACQQYAGQEVIDSQAQEYLDFILPPETYKQKREKSLAEGGYGTPREQLEIIAEQGIDAFRGHIQSIKTKIPKP